jgi:hypothetical protein
VATASSTGYTLTSSPATVTATVAAPPAPSQFAPVPITGANGAANSPVLHFSGPANSAYRVWSTTNLALKPVTTKWTLLGSGAFSGGADTFACPANGPATQYYTITQP